MSIPYAPEVEAQLAEYRAYLTPENAREAFDTFVNAARNDDRYSFFPHAQGMLRRTVRYMIGSDWSYRFITNRSDLLFYYRQPCGRVSDLLLEDLKRKGLDVGYVPRRAPRRHEINVRIASREEAQIVLNDCFGVGVGMGSGLVLRQSAS